MLVSYPGYVVSTIYVQSNSIYTMCKACDIHMIEDLGNCLSISIHVLHWHVAFGFKKWPMRRLLASYTTSWCSANLVPHHCIIKMIYSGK